MKKEKILLVLWIVFGFLFITAVDSILYFIVHLIYFGLSSLAISLNTLKWVLPITTFILYGLTAYILIKRVVIKSRISQVYLSEFPKKLIVLMGIIAFTLNPITNLVAGIYAAKNSEYLTVDLSEFRNFIIWFENGLVISRWVVIIFLLIVFLSKLRSFKNS